MTRCAFLFLVVACGAPPVASGGSSSGGAIGGSSSSGTSGTSAGSSAGSSSGCTPGQVASCLGIDNCPGQATCIGGQLYGACVCPTAGSTSGGGSSGGGSTSAASSTSSGAATSGGSSASGGSSGGACLPPGAWCNFNEPCCGVCKEFAWGASGCSELDGGDPPWPDGGPSALDAGLDAGPCVPDDAGVLGLNCTCVSTSQCQQVCGDSVCSLLCNPSSDSLVAGPAPDCWGQFIDGGECAGSGTYGFCIPWQCHNRNQGCIGNADCCSGACNAPDPGYPGLCQ